MKMQEAMTIINSKCTGYYVSFEWVEGSCLRSDGFPDPKKGDKLIETEEEAWELARKFAEKTWGNAVNFIVRDQDFRCVLGYEEKEIKNR